MGNSHKWKKLGQVLETAAIGAEWFVEKIIIRGFKLTFILFAFSYVLECLVHLIVVENIFNLKKVEELNEESFFSFFPENCMNFCLRFMNVHYKTITISLFVILIAYVLFKERKENKYEK